MNDVPFGFDRPRDDDDDDKNQSHQDQPSGSGPVRPERPGSGPKPESPTGPNNPFAAIFGGAEPADLGAAFQRLGQLLSHESGPVNWELARDVARQALAATDSGATGGVGRGQGRGETATTEEAIRLAELWLDTVTVLPAGTVAAVAWSRSEWIESTLPVWKQLVEPVAGQVVQAMAEVLPSEMQAMSGPLLGVMRSFGGAIFGAQIGQALATLATEVLTSTDVGLPLGPAGKAALLPTNVAAFGFGLGIDDEQIRLYLALREAAHHRLFGHVPWLRSHLLSAVESYAKGISVDTARLEQAVGQLDPSNPEAVQEALTSGMFAPERTPSQRAALARLETALALVEGWVDTVVDTAAADRLPSTAALRETVRRRRATGGPAEQTFATLVGLELRPRRLRDAADLWRLLGESRGAAGRDAVWDHPDLLPTAKDLDDPQGFVQRASGPDPSELAGFPFSPDDPTSGSSGEQDRPGRNDDLNEGPNNDRAPGGGDDQPGGGDDQR